MCAVKPVPGTGIIVHPDCSHLSSLSNPLLFSPCTLTELHLINHSVAPFESHMPHHPKHGPMSITTRPSLPTSTSDFALPSSPSTSLPTTSSDDLSPFMLRLRRPSLLGPRPGGLSLSAEARLHSPLVTSFTRRHSSNGTGDDSESDRDKMSTDSDSGNATPLLPGPSIDSESDTSMKTNRPRTPPRLTSASSSSEGIDEQMSGMRLPPRRLSKAVRLTPSFLLPHAAIYAPAMSADEDAAYPAAGSGIAHTGERGAVGGPVSAYARVVQHASAHAPRAV